jgi:hypothetical protein
MKTQMGVIKTDDIRGAQNTTMNVVSDFFFPVNNACEDHRFPQTEQARTKCYSRPRRFSDSSIRAHDKLPLIENYSLTKNSLLAAWFHVKGGVS